MRSEKLAAKYAKGELFIGTHCHIAEPVIPEILALQGFDFLWIDTEHSAIDYKDLNMMIMSAHLADTPALVRIPACTAVHAKTVLEMGPDGIIFPNVRSVEDVRTAVAAVRYPPDGVRGYGPQRAVRYGGISNEEWLARESKKVWCIPQIEDYRAIENMEELLAVPGIDALMIGPNDMSGTMGKLTQLDDPEVARYLDMYVKKGRAAGIPVGTSFGYGERGDEAIRKWVKRGVDFICVGSDLNFLAGGASALYKTIKKIGETERPAQR